MASSSSSRAHSSASSPMSPLSRVLANGGGGGGGEGVGWPASGGRNESPSATLALTAVTSAAFDGLDRSPSANSISVADGFERVHLTEASEFGSHSASAAGAAASAFGSPFVSASPSRLGTASGSRFADGPPLASFDAFPGLGVSGAAPSSSLDDEGPSDILHYYGSYAEARRQIVAQALAVVRVAARGWSTLTTVARDKASKARLTRPREGVQTSARHSTLAASYMSMVAAQHEQHAASQQQQAAAAAALGTLDENEASDLPGSPDGKVRASRPPSASRPAVSDLDRQKAVHTAHQTRLLLEAETLERARLEAEDARYQQQILFAQQKMEAEPSGGACSGESAYVHLQEESKSVPHAPLRVGLVGCGALGALIAEQILEQFCGLAPEAATRDTSFKAALPTVATSASGLRLFISTRRPDHPAIMRLVKRCGLSSGGAGTHSSGGCVTVYFDNARLVTECNVVLVCTLPHQVQLLSTTLRALAEDRRPRSQLFFSITSSHTLRALQHLLGEAVCLARTSLILPHLVLKSSDSARSAMNDFLSTVLAAAARSFEAQAAFRNALGQEGIRRVLESFKKDLERDVASCFLKEAPTPTTQQHVPSYARLSSLTSSSSAGTSFAAAGSLASLVRRSPSPMTSPSSPHPHLPMGSAVRSTASSVGLVGSVYSATPSGSSGALPKLRDLQLREEAQIAANAAAAQAARLPPHLSSTRTTSSRRVLEVNPAIVTPGSSMGAGPLAGTFQRQERTSLFQANFF